VLFLECQDSIAIKLYFIPLPDCQALPAWLSWCEMSIIAQFQTMCCWGRKPAVSEVILLHGVCFLAVNLSIRVALLCQGHSESVVSLACSGFKELPMTGIYSASMFHLGFMMVLEDWAGRRRLCHSLKEVISISLAKGPPDPDCSQLGTTRFRVQSRFADAR